MPGKYDAHADEGPENKRKLSLKEVEMLYKLAWGMCTAAVGRSYSLN
jgi:hypothetical protein